MERGPRGFALGGVIVAMLLGACGGSGSSPSGSGTVSMAAVKSDADAAAACQTVFGNPADAVALTTYKGDTANVTWTALVGSPGNDFACNVLPSGAAKNVVQIVVGKDTNGPWIQWSSSKEDPTAVDAYLAKAKERITT